MQTTRRFGGAAPALARQRAAEIIAFVLFQWPGDTVAKENQQHKTEFVMTTAPDESLVPPSERKLTQAEIAQQLRKELNAIPGIRASVQDLSQAGFTGQRGYPVELSVRGSDWNALVAASEQFRQKLAQSGKVVDLDTNYQVGMPELRIVPDRARAADLGVSMGEVSTAISMLVASRWPRSTSDKAASACSCRSRK